MPRRIVRTERAYQPQGPHDINIGSPIARGLTYVFTPDASGWWPNNGAIQIASIGGAVVRQTTRASNQAYTRSGSHGSAVTMLAVAGFSATGIDRALVSSGDASNNRRLLYIAGSEQVAMFTGSPGGTRQANGGAVGAASRLRVYVGTDNGVTNRVFIDGIQQGTATAGFSTADPTTIAVGGYYTSGALNSGFAWPGGIALVAVWGRVLSDAEIASVSANPWQLFEPQRRSMSWPGAGGINYTLSAEGSVSFSGAATVNRTRQLAVSGSVAFSGGTNLLRERVLLPSGSVVFSGTAAFSTASAFTLSAGGAVTFSGEASLRKEKILTAGGPVVFSGVASISFLPDGVATTTPYRNISIGLGNQNRIS